MRADDQPVHPNPPAAPRRAAVDDADEVVDDVGISLRGRIAGWIAVAMAGFAFGQAILAVAGAAGLFTPVISSDRSQLILLAVLSVFGGTLALVLRRQFLRAPGTRLTALLAVFTALAIVVVLPEDYFGRAIPQLVWIAPLVAAATCRLRLIVIVWVIQTVALVARFGFVEAFRTPASWLVSLFILALVLLVRWLHDEGLREAADANGRRLHVLFHDQLTGLPNRFRFVEELDARLRTVDAGDAADVGCAVLRIDLREFALLSDALGRDAGDEALRWTARTLTDGVDDAALVARAGSDDFLVLVPDVGTVDEAVGTARRLLDRLSVPFEVTGTTVHVTPRAGVVHVAPGVRTDAETVLQRAERAVAAATAGGHSRISVAEDDPSAPTARRFRISQALRGAIDRNELHVVYQPIVHLASGRLEKAEALVRWTSPELGEVSPSEFIPIAEATGTIERIGDWVFEQAVAQTLEWRAAGYGGFQISVNRSPVQFAEDGPGRNVCLRILDAHDAPPDCVTLELTETVLASTDDTMRQRLAGLRESGITLSLDDFGTGFSSISHLHSFEIDVVKIDRSFVRGLAPGTREHVLCESIIAMAHSLDMVVVAEGVETEAQRDVLVGLGCDYGQGYLFSRPVPPDEFAALIPAPTEA